MLHLGQQTTKLDHLSTVAAMLCAGFPDPRQAFTNQCDSAEQRMLRRGFAPAGFPGLRMARGRLASWQKKSALRTSASAVAALFNASLNAAPAGSNRNRSWAIQNNNLLSRRRLLVSVTLPVLQACTGPLAPLSGSVTTPDAEALLMESAAAQGAAALSKIDDLSVRYAGAWRPLVGRLQPALVDAGFRGGSEERLLLRQGLVGQAHTGPEGRKQVVRQTARGGEGDVRVWFNGEEADDRDRRDAAALVVDGYGVFLLGPMLLAGAWAVDRALTLERAGFERIVVDQVEHECDVLRVVVRPGLGFSATDQMEMLMDRSERLMRRVRFTLEGLKSTRGAIAEVDVSEHITLHGVRWPTRFHERLLRPLPLAVHDWQLMGLDVNRGLLREELYGPAFTGKALVPANSGPFRV